MNFVDQMRRRILDYQVQKIRREQQKNECQQTSKTQNKAKQTLFDLDQQMDASEDQTDFGRWSTHRLHHHYEERVNSMRKDKIRNHGSHKKNPELNSEKNYLAYHSHSEKTIPQLKFILQRLETPSQKGQQKPKKLIGCYSKKLIQTAIKSKNEIKATIKFEKKSKQVVQQAQNKRPVSTSGGYGYQKIKRSLGKGKDDMIDEKEILCQLIRGNVTKTPATNNALSNMTNYFSFKTERKKSSIKLK